MEFLYSLALYSSKLVVTVALILFGLITLLMAVKGLKSAKKDNEDKKILKAKLYNHIVFIFMGDNIPSRIIEMSKNGYTKELLNGINSQNFVLSYLPSEKKLYYADAIENVIQLQKFPKQDFIHIIKDIFYL